MEKINYKNQGSGVKGGKLSSYSSSPPILGGDEGVVIRRSNHPQPSSTSTPPSPLSTSTPLNPLFNKEGKPTGRGVRKEGVPKAGAFDKEGKPQGREVKKLLLCLAASLSLLAAPAHALDISDYTAYPPFLPRVTSPNILFLLDYSKSMVRPAYGTCKNIKSSSDCRNTFYQSGIGEINQTGTVTITNGSNNLTGSGTKFSTELSAGNEIRIKGKNYTVSSIASDTSLTFANYSALTNIPYRGTTESGLAAYTVGSLRGTVSVTNGSKIVTGTGTKFSTELKPGNRISIYGGYGGLYTVDTITSDTSLTLTSNYSSWTTSGVTVEKADDYSPITPYSGYFDNGYSGSGSYSDSSAYKYTCTAASNGNCVKDVAGAWNGNYLNWLAATQFDILKKVAIGGDVNPAPEQGNPGTVRSILTDGYTFRKTMPFDQNIYSKTEPATLPCTGKIPASLCKAWPDMTGKYSWITTPGSGVTTVFGSPTDASDLETDWVGRSAKLPFDFTVYGKTYGAGSNFYIYNMGYILFYEPSWRWYSYLFPYYDSTYGFDIILTKSSSIKTFTTGSAPDRRFVISYENVINGADSGKSDPMTFQIVLYEGSNHIVYQYKEVRPSQTWGAGKYAWVGVYHWDGVNVREKRWSYNTTDLSNSQAIFATPHLSFTVTPRSGTTDFQPAAPFNVGGATDGYKVDININENSSCTSEGVGCYYNKDRGKYYNHPTLGLLQDFRDGELGGTLGFRLAIEQLNGTTSANMDGGKVVKHFNAKDTTGWSSLLNATRSQTPTTNTPLAEALQIAEGYFKQDTSYNMGLTSANSWTNDGTSSTCASTGTNYDPYCFQSAAQRVSCCKSFILLVSSGNYSNDNRTNIYGDAADSDGQLIAGAWRSTDDAGSEGTKLNGGYLDNVAYKAHTTDWRSDLEGTQNLTLYVVNTFGEGSGDGTAILKKAAKYGGFDDADGNNAYDAGEDDKNSNGVPDTYFEASGGSDLKSKIIDAVMEIMKSSASGTSVSVLSTSAGGEGAIYQAYFYPAKVEGTTDERTWPGFMKSFFLDKKQNLRDDSSGGTYTCSNGSCTYSGTPNAALSATGDKIAQMCLNTATNEVKVKLYADANGNYIADTANDGTCPSVTSSGDPIVVGMDDVVSVWEAGKKLALRDKSTRNIYTWVDTDHDGVVDNGDFSSLGGEALAFTTANASTLKPYLRAGTADVDGTGPYIAFTAAQEAEYVIRFIRGEAITPDTTSSDNTGVSYRNRCVSISGASQEAGCSGSNQRVWALGDIINSTPTLVSGPGEQYDLIYNNASTDTRYGSFRTKYKDRRRMVYVGANDGMLHAFNAGIFNESTTSFSANPSSGNGWGSSTGLGDELWAFVPYDNLPHLQWLACNGTSSDPSQCGSSEYTHVYYVDSRPKVTDVRIFCRDASADAAYNSLNYPSSCASGQSGASHPNGWGTILIMGMRLGGGAIDVDLNGDGDTADAGEKSFRSAYYALDVTDPEKPPRLLWRFYVGDGSASNNSLLGFTTSYPAIARIGDKNATGAWYMIIGSGPNNSSTIPQASGVRDYGGSSTDLAGKVYVVDLLDGSPDKTFTLDSNTYMGDPLVVDENFDFSSDVIYIGSSIGTGTDDVGGKVYRIRTNGRIPSGGDESCPNPVTSTNNWCRSVLINAGEPILTSPSVATDLDRKLWVFFGTGRLRNSGSPSDLTNFRQQKFYGIKDDCGKAVNFDATPVTGSTCSDLYSESQLANVSSSKVTLSSTTVTDVSAPTSCSSGCTIPTDYNQFVTKMKDFRGWFVNLGYDGTAASERVLSRPAVLGGIVLFTTYKPAASICSIFGDSRLYALNYQTGTAYNKAVVGSSSTGIGADASTTGTYISKGIELGKGMPTAVGIAVGEKVTGFVQKSTGEIIRIESDPGTSIKSGAASWREKTGGGTSEIETIYKHIVK